MSCPDKAHVICCNDSVEHVHIGTEEQAQAKLEELAKAHFDSNPWHWRERALFMRSSLQRRQGSGFDIPDQEAFQEYRLACYWHIHTVSVSIE